MLRRRDLHADEIEEARKVFGDTIPYEKIVVSDLEGEGGRKFTVPNIDGSIVMGLGSDMFDSALSSEPNRHTFIHELTHAWQITHRSIFKTLCSALKNKLDEVVYGRDQVYDYQAGSDWDSYNMEQQAQIVADWYWKKYRNTVRVGASDRADIENLRYIQQNILMERS